MRTVLIIFCLVSFFSCKNEHLASLAQKNTAISTLHQIAVVADEEMRENSTIIDTLDYYLAPFFPILNQPEPYFDFRHFTFNELSSQKVRRELKVYVILTDTSKEGKALEELKKDLGPQVVEEKEGNIKIIREKWAFNQLVFHIYGPGDEALRNLIIKSYPNLINRIETFYEGQLEASAFVNKHSRLYAINIWDNHGIQLHIPKNYMEAASSEDFSWYRDITEKGSHNILVFKEPYTSQDQFTREYLKNTINAFGKRTISSEAEGSYFRINDIDLPVFLYKREVDGRYAIETRGIWELEGDFMGGPYVSFSILDETTNEIYHLLGFVFEPGEDKRDNMLKLNYILRNAKFDPVVE